MANLRINTTQNIIISFNNASLSKRIFAFFLDLLFMVLYFLLIFILWNNLFKNYTISDNFMTMAIGVIIFLPIIMYSFIFELLLQGCTPGKKVLGLRVIKIDGSQASASDYFIRWVMRLIDIWSFSGIIGILSIVFSSKNQRLGDILSHCGVINQLAFKRGLQQSIYQEVEDTYKPVYLQVVSLSDKDMAIIVRAYHNYLRTKDVSLLDRLTKKVTTTLGIEPKEKSNQDFLATIIKDYNFLTARI
ncbi:RDD family protein [Myroides sp. LJL115]